VHLWTPTVGKKLTVRGVGGEEERKGDRGDGDPGGEDLVVGYHGTRGAAQTGGARLRERLGLKSKRARRDPFDPWWQTDSALLDDTHELCAGVKGSEVLLAVHLGVLDVAENQIEQWEYSE